jgi:hypothetical protein
MLQRHVSIKFLKDNDRKVEANPASAFFFSKIREGRAF